MPDHAEAEREPREPKHADGPVTKPFEPVHRGKADPQLRVVPEGRHRRRVTTDPPPGSDPRPTPEAPRHSGTENDDRLKGDKPPHWA